MAKLAVFVRCPVLPFSFHTLHLRGGARRFALARRCCFVVLHLPSSMSFCFFIHRCPPFFLPLTFRFTSAVRAPRRSALPHLSRLRSWSSSSFLLLLSPPSRSFIPFILFVTVRVVAFTQLFYVDSLHLVPVPFSLSLSTVFPSICRALFGPGIIIVHLGRSISEAELRDAVSSHPPSAFWTPENRNTDLVNRAAEIIRGIILPVDLGIDPGTWLQPPPWNLYSRYKTKFAIWKQVCV